jgi:hypothetical protein
LCDESRFSSDSICLSGPSSGAIMAASFASNTLSHGSHQVAKVNALLSA